MSSFHSNSDFEDACVERIRAFFKTTIGPARGLEMLVLKREGQRICKQGLDVDLQRAVGDAFLMRNGLVCKTVDFKCERKFTGNLFLETHSNFSARVEIERLGWLHTLKTDSLWYYFDDIGKLYEIELEALRAWLDSPFQDARGRDWPSRLLSLREIAQGKHAQKNLTVGRLLAVSDLSAANGLLTSVSDIPALPRGEAP